MKNLFRLVVSTLLLFSVFFSIFSATSQTIGENGTLPVIDQEKFEGRFCLSIPSDGDFNYCIVDLDKLDGRFERVYFLNLTYKETKIINIDPDITKSQLWFKSYYLDEEKEISRLLEDLRKKTRDASLSMSGEEKDSWLMKNDKLPTK